MKEQKLILVKNDDMTELNNYINEGYIVTQISGSRCGNALPACYVLIEK